jgi:hypothetical protein
LGRGKLGAVLQGIMKTNLNNNETVLFCTMYITQNTDKLCNLLNTPTVGLFGGDSHYGNVKMCNGVFGYNSGLHFQSFFFNYLSKRLIWEFFLSLEFNLQSSVYSPWCWSHQFVRVEMMWTSETLEIHSLLKWLNGQESLIAFTNSKKSNLEAENVELIVRPLHLHISHSGGITS